MIARGLTRQRLRYVAVAFSLGVLVVSLATSSVPHPLPPVEPRASGALPSASALAPEETLERAAPTPASKLAVLATVPVGSGPFEASYLSADGYVYVVNAYTDNISILSGTALVGTVWIGSGAYYLTYGNGYVYVVNSNTDNVSVLRGTSLVGTVNVGFSPDGDAYDSDDADLYVTNVFSNNVSVISGTQVIDSISTGVIPQTALYDPVNGYVYIANTGSNTVSVLQGTAVESTVNVGSDPFLGTYDTSNGDVYVVNTNSSNVSVLSGTSLVGTVATGLSYLPEVTYDSANGYVYAANTQTNNVSIISGTSLVGTVAVGGSPNQPVYDPITGDVYVASYLTNNMSVLSGTSLVGTVAVGPQPSLGPVVGAGGLVFVTGTNSSFVSVVNGTSLIQTIGVGSFPGIAAYDPTNGLVYVPNGYSDNVSIIGMPPTPQYKVSFTTDPTACGLIGFNGTNYLDGASVVVPPGSYGVDAAPCAGYSVLSLTGTGEVTVAGSSATVDGNGSLVASFEPTTTAYAVTFALNPAGCGAITFNGTSYLNGGSTHVRPGSYAVSVAACAGYSLQNVTGTGSVSVQGGTATVTGPGGLVANFTSSSSSGSGILGLPGDEGYLLIGGIAVVAVAIIAGVLVARRRRPPVESYEPTAEGDPPAAESP